MNDTPKRILNAQKINGKSLWKNILWDNAKRNKEMTTIEKIAFIRQERYAELNDWCKEFISDLFENASDEEELTRRQIDKVDEIWEDLGL